MKSVVYFQFTHFASLNEDGVVLQESYGYQLYDEYERYSKDGMAYEQLSAYTPPYVLDMIEEERNDLYMSILDKGFYWNEKWVIVDESGNILETK